MVERTQVNLTVDDYSELKNNEANILMFVENPPRGRLDAPMLITQDNMNRKLGKKIGHLWLNAVQDVLDTGVYQCQVMRVSYDYSQSNGGGNLPKDRDGKDPKNNNRFITFDVLIFDGLNLLEFNAYKLRQLEQGVGNEQVSVHWDNVLRSFNVNFSEPVHDNTMYVIIRKTDDTNTPHDVNTSILMNNLVRLDSLPIKLIYSVNDGDTSDIDIELIKHDYFLQSLKYPTFKRVELVLSSLHYPKFVKQNLVLSSLLYPTIDNEVLSLNINVLDGVLQSNIKDGMFDDSLNVSIVALDGELKLAPQCDVVDSLLLGINIFDGLLLQAPEINEQDTLSIDISVFDGRLDKILINLDLPPEDKLALDIEIFDGELK